MSDTDPTEPEELSIREPPRILVPVEVLEGQTISEPLAAFLASSNIVVLGYHVLPEQTPTEQASMQFEERAQAAAEDVADVFRGMGRGVEIRVVFTHDRDQTIDRVAAEVGATALLLPNPTGPVEDVLVPLRGAIDVDRLADLVGTLLSESETTVTLWGLAESESDFDADAAVSDAYETLIERGLTDEQIHSEVSVSDAPVRDIVEESDDFDVIVMGEGELSLLAVLFGEATERVARGAAAPVLVVRGNRPDEPESAGSVSDEAEKPDGGES